MERMVLYSMSVLYRTGETGWINWLLLNEKPVDPSAGRSMFQRRPHLLRREEHRALLFIFEGLGEALHDLGSGCEREVCLVLIPLLLVQLPKLRQYLPAFPRQADLFCQWYCLLQMSDGLLILTPPVGEHRQGSQIGDTIAPVVFHGLAEVAHVFLGLLDISTAQQG